MPSERARVEDADSAEGTELPLTVDLGRGQRLTVRAAAEDDVTAIGDLYRNLSLEDTYRRFFSMVKVTDGLVRGWLQRCHEGGRDLVAVVEGEGLRAEVVAEAGYVRLPNGNGEFAITVARERSSGSVGAIS